MCIAVYNLFNGSKLIIMTEKFINNVVHDLGCDVAVLAHFRIMIL